MRRVAIFFLFILSLFDGSPANATTKRIVILGDSLVAGYGLKTGEDYPSKLQEALVRKGYDVKIDNAGVSGDTSAGGVSRLDWSISGEPSPSLVIIELGANDMLRGIDPEVTKNNLQSILIKLKEKKIPAMVFGMKAPANLGPDYRKNFDGLYSELTKEFSVPFYPFFLDGVATIKELNQADGIHPTAKGIDIIVKKTLPLVSSHIADE